MKSYTVHVDIALPRDRVLELFDSTENLFKWQKGLQGFEHLSGEAGQEGATSKLVYKNGKQTIELTETITRRDLPEAFDGTYAWKGGMNTLENRFIELGPDSTRWESTCSYQLSNPMLKIMGALFPGMFRKQNQKFLDAFKAFAEDGKDVREG